MNPLVRHLPWLLFLLLAPAGSRAQRLCDPGDCACLETLGQELEEKGNLSGAIRQYTAAKECNPDNAIRLNHRIEAVFAKINRLREQALADEQKARENIRQTAILKAQADHNAAEAKRQRNIALQQKAVADDARISAIASRQAADSLKRVFARQDSLTRQTLKRLDKALDDLASEYVRQAHQQIHLLAYDSARALADRASALRRKLDVKPLQKVYMELAYVYAETGSLATPAIADSLAIWYASPLGAFKDRIDFRVILERLDSIAFFDLERRYYPVTISVPGGTFIMGINEDQRNQIIKTYAKALSYREDDLKNWTKAKTPIHPVELDSFELAQTETTWLQYNLYCKATNSLLPPSPPWGRQNDNPVVNVSWGDTQAYIKWLNTQKPGIYSLPTEAEWEYAAKGGEKGIMDNKLYAGGDKLEDLGWCYNNSQEKTHGVASKKPNRLNLYDMSGNVWEWCLDWYDEYPSMSQSNPAGPAGGFGKVLRGGAWNYIDFYCGPGDRYGWNPIGRDINIGFRISRHFK